MPNKVKIIADSTCDLSSDLLEQYSVSLIPLTVTLGDQSFEDGVSVFPDDLYAYYRKTKQLPKSAAPTLAAFHQQFQYWTQQGYDVVCFTISSHFSASYANASLSAKAFENVYVVDSLNLSTGIGLQVLNAAQLAQQGKTAAQIYEAACALREKVRASFVIDTLEFLWKGGRCSGVMALGANVLRLKPCIEVTGGKMEVGKKYRGNLSACLSNYVRAKLEGRDDIDQRRVFITHSGMSRKEDIALVREAVERYQHFDEILVTRAGSTISTHCGPDTLGVLFIVK